MLFFRINRHEINLKKRFTIGEVCSKTNRHWQLYINKLKSNNFYKGYQENSKVWKKLHREAKSIYYQIWISDENEKNAKLRRLLDSLSYTSSVQDIFSNFSILPPNSGVNWMNISEQDLRKLMLPFEGCFKKDRNE